VTVTYTEEAIADIVEAMGAVPNCRRE